MLNTDIPLKGPVFRGPCAPINGFRICRLLFLVIVHKTLKRQV